MIKDYIYVKIYFEIDVATQFVEVSDEKRALVCPYRLQLRITHIFDVSTRLSTLLQRHENSWFSRVEARFRLNIDLFSR